MLITFTSITHGKNSAPKKRILNVQIQCKKIDLNCAMYFKCKYMKDYIYIYGVGLSLSSSVGYPGGPRSCYSCFTLMFLEGARGLPSPPSL